MSFITTTDIRAFPASMRFPASNWSGKEAEITHIHKRRDHRIEYPAKTVVAHRLDFRFHGDDFIALVEPVHHTTDGADGDYDHQHIHVYTPENLEHAGEKGWATVSAIRFRCDAYWTAQDDPGHGLERDDSNWLIAVGQVLANII